MTVRRTTRVPSRSKGARPVVDKLFQKPLSDWLAEWKANKARTPVPSQPPARQPSHACESE
jgi:hypothetical protein